MSAVRLNASNGRSHPGRLIRHGTLWATLFLAGLSVLIQWPLSPAIQQTPTRDSGIFLYVSSRLLSGDTLYTQIWDHKPPVVFLINALGLAGTGGSIWGVWLLQTAFLGGAALLVFALLRRNLGLAPALAAGTAGLLALSYVLHGGNTTEGYALLFQGAAVYAWERAEGDGRSGLWGALAGVCLGLLLFTKQSLAAAGAAIGLYLLLDLVLHRNWRRIASLAWIAAGVVGVLVIFLAWFAGQGTLRAFWDAAFVYNQAYSNLGLLERVSAVLDTLETMTSMPGFALAILSWVAYAGVLLCVYAAEIAPFLGRRSTGVGAILLGALLAGGSLGAELLSAPVAFSLGLLQVTALLLGALLILAGAGTLWLRSWQMTLRRLGRGTFPLPEGVRRLAGLAVLWLPVEVIAISLSGRNFVHYYIALFPVSVILLALLFYLLRLQLPAKPLYGLSGAWMAGLVLATSVAPLVALANQFHPNGDDQIRETVAYIQANTGADQSVLLWGAEPGVDFLAGRTLGSRYVHQGPFYLNGYTSPALTQVLLGELQENRPELIIDVGNDDTPFPNRVAGKDCRFTTAELPQGMDAVFDYICSHYRPEGTAGPQQWKVYRRSG
ncbi:MAG: glycosyltransferase family 39 protein [Anaerolineaceae bacterium]|nr:glycosyltransferase family 39 protein [Anaerolineaceae bacterium]